MSVLSRIHRSLLSLVLCTTVCAGLAAGCASQQRPSLRVVAVEQAATKPVLLVQVTNPERRPIRLQRLQYTFGSADHSAQGEVLLSRDVAAGAAVIVEVPVDLEGHQGPYTLEGNLTALIDRIVRIYPVTVDVPLETPK